MKNTFKKTLLAAAVAGFSVNAFAAADITTTVPLGVSVEGQLEVLAANDIDVTLGAEYAVGDVITIAFSGAALDVASVDSTVTITKLAPAAGTLTLGLLEATSSSVKYRVTENSSVDSTVGATLTLPGLEFDGADVIAAGGVTATYSAVTNSGLSLDTTGAKLSTRVFYTGNELAPKVTTALNSVIDVEEDRKLFTADAADELVISAEKVATIDIGGGNTVNISEGTITVNKVSYTVSSDFSWVVDTNTTTAGIQPEAGTFTVSNCAATVPATPVVVTATALTFACSDALANVTVAIDPKQGDAEFPESLSPKSFSVEAKYDFEDGNADDATKTFSGLNGGAWTLNGSQVRVPYMVVGGSRFGIIANVTNHGSKDGSMTVDVFAEDGTKIVSNYPAGTSKAGSVTSVAPALLAALGGSPATVTKFSFQITTNVPEDDVIVYAAYTDNTTSERAIVNNDSKVQIKGFTVTGGNSN